jgi:hypothetical protein
MNETCKRTMVSIIGSVVLAALALFGGGVHAGYSKFPVGNCRQRACDASPYKLEWLTDATPMCFRISSLPDASCNDTSQYRC